MILRYFGSTGIADRLREHIRLAQLFAGWIDASPDFERLAPVPMSVVCFRARPSGTTRSDDELNVLNRRLIDALNATGDVYLSHTMLDGCVTLRLAIGNIRTMERHVRRAWELLQETLHSVVSEPAVSPS
jgi:aromatic-L-amino-acid decarboxylase